MNKLYKFEGYDGRYGRLDGLFVADPDDVAAAMDKTVWFHDALGKHSEVEVTLNEDSIICYEDAPEEVVAYLANVECGYNPLYYIDEDDD